MTQKPEEMEDQLDRTLKGMGVGVVRTVKLPSILLKELRPQDCGGRRALVRILPTGGIELATEVALPRSSPFAGAPPASERAFTLLGAATHFLAEEGVQVQLMSDNSGVTGLLVRSHLCEELTEDGLRQRLAEQGQLASRVQCGLEPPEKGDDFLANFRLHFRPTLAALLPEVIKEKGPIIPTFDPEMRQVMLERSEKLQR